MASITPFGPAIKAGTAGIRLVRKSSIVKWISPKKVEKATDKGMGKGKLDLEDFTKEILKNKPMNSPIPEKWYKKMVGISLLIVTELGNILIRLVYQ